MRLAGQACTCELVQVGPVGREVSAVNVPASAGTQVLAELLGQWVAFKERNRMNEVQDGDRAGAGEQR